MKKIVYLVCLLTFFIACSKDYNSAEESGVIKRQTYTTCKYGTHLLVDNNGQTKFALKSEKIDLNNYINKNVTISGPKQDGIDGGPEYITVYKVK
jgi:hypothetical protein